MRHCVGVADERAVAEVAVFHSGTVRSNVALAGLCPCFAYAILTGVIHCASVVVIARLVIHGCLAVLTTKCFVADIQGALVGIITIQWSRANALVALADVHQCAHCVVVAISAVWSKDTADGRVAGIVGADITVIALDALARTDAARALVVGGAGIAVIARPSFIHRRHLAVASCRNAGVFETRRVLAGVTSDDGVRVCGADKRHCRLVADECAIAEIVVLGTSAISRVGALADVSPAFASPAGASITHCARVAIVTPNLVGQIETALLRIADIVSTEVAVLAFQRLAALALASVAEIACGAQAPVFARIAIVGSVHAAALRIARVVGAGVLVIADNSRPDADILVAGVCCGAGVAIIAGYACLRFVFAAALRIAGVLRALVAIIADNGRTKALAACALVVGRAGISIVARNRVVGVEATLF